MITRTYLNDAGEVVTEEVSPADFYRAAQDEHEAALTAPPARSAPVGGKRRCGQFGTRPGGVPNFHRTLSPLVSRETHLVSREKPQVTPGTLRFRLTQQTPPSLQEERVARAIVSARGVDPDASMRRRVAAHGKDSDFEHAYFMWEDALAEARAAIAAMQWVEVERIDAMRLMLSDWLLWSESKDLSQYRYVESGDMHADISSLAHSTREVLRLQPHSLNSAQSAPNQSGEKT